MTSPSDRVALQRGFPRGGLMIAGGLDLGLVGLVLTRMGNGPIGVAMLLLTLGANFTGYLLPWDQTSLWAVTVAANMAGATPLVGHQGPGAALLGLDGVQFIHEKSDIRFMLLGGSTVGPAALLRFYVLHCIFLPILTAILMAVHFWRIRKDGFSGPL